MPRTARAAVGGSCYHVLDRGNRRGQVFHGPDDYAAFVRLLRQATARIPLRVLGWCLMPNHFHAVVWPERDEELAGWLHWLLTTHACRYNKQYGLSGHVWQGRSHAFPIQEDDPLLTVLRYVERNALRGGLVTRAEDWPWGSLAQRRGKCIAEGPTLVEGPVALPRTWLSLVNGPQTEAELAALRRCVERGQPYGGEAWTKRTAARLGLASTLRPRGRPKKKGS